MALDNTETHLFHNFFARLPVVGSCRDDESLRVHKGGIVK